MIDLDEMANGVGDFFVTAIRANHAHFEAQQAMMRAMATIDERLDHIKLAPAAFGMSAKQMQFCLFCVLYFATNRTTRGLIVPNVQVALMDAMNDKVPARFSTLKWVTGLACLEWFQCADWLLWRRHKKTLEQAAADTGNNMANAVQAAKRTASIAAEPEKKKTKKSGIVAKPPAEPLTGKRKDAAAPTPSSKKSNAVASTTAPSIIAPLVPPTATAASTTASTTAPTAASTTAASTTAPVVPVEAAPTTAPTATAPIIAPTTVAPTAPVATTTAPASATAPVAAPVATTAAPSATTAAPTTTAASATAPVAPAVAATAAPTATVAPTAPVAPTTAPIVPANLPMAAPAATSAAAPSTAAPLLAVVVAPAPSIALVAAAATKPPAAHTSLPAASSSSSSLVASESGVEFLRRILSTAIESRLLARLAPEESMLKYDEVRRAHDPRVDSHRLLDENEWYLLLLHVTATASVRDVECFLDLRKIDPHQREDFLFLFFLGKKRYKAVCAVRKACGCCVCTLF